VLINETMAGLLGMEDPIGKTIRRGDQSYEIIGIAGDFHFQHLSNKVQPLVLLYSGVKNKMFVRTGASIGRAINLLNEHISQMNDQGFTYSFISDEYKGLYRSERRISYAIFVFAMLTVLLSSIGLIGLVTYNIEMRTREIGIRKVCGASVKEVILLLSRVLIKWYLIGSFISCALAWIVMKTWLDNFAYRISLSWLFFISGSMIILGVTVLTVGMQTWKASIANPVDILKCE
jgi:ABC-type antimicrobial peptide transport system permease subunit